MSLGDVTRLKVNERIVITHVNVELFAWVRYNVSESFLITNAGISPILIEDTIFVPLPISQVAVRLNGCDT